MIFNKELPSSMRESEYFPNFQLIEANQIYKWKN